MKSPLAAEQHLPQDDTTLGLLIIAREETESMGELAQDAANMRIHHSRADPSQPGCCLTRTHGWWPNWCGSEATRAHSILVKFDEAEKMVKELVRAP